MSYLLNGLHQHLSVSPSFPEQRQVLNNCMSGLQKQEWGGAFPHIVFSKPLCEKLHSKSWLFWGSQGHICSGPQDQPPQSVSTKDWWWHQPSNQWLEGSEDHSDTDRQNRQAQTAIVPSAPTLQLRFFGNTSGQVQVQNWLTVNTELTVFQKIISEMFLRHLVRRVE